MNPRLEYDYTSIHAENLMAHVRYHWSLYACEGRNHLIRIWFNAEGLFKVSSDEDTIWEGSSPEEAVKVYNDAR